MRVGVFEEDRADHTTSAPRRLAQRGEVLGRNLDWSAPARCSAVALPGAALVSLAMLATGLLVTHLLQRGAIGRWDDDATAWLADHRVGWADQVTSVISRSADTLGIIGLASVVVLALAWRHRWWQSAVLVLALTLELLVFLVVNFSVDRPRPDVTRLGSTPSTSSFPSGHSAAAVALYGSVALFVWLATERRGWRSLAAAVALLAPLAVAISRVYRGMHQPIDVLFGLCMGAAVTAVAVLAVSAALGAPATVTSLPPRTARSLADDGSRASREVGGVEAR